MDLCDTCVMIWLALIYEKNIKIIFNYQLQIENNTNLHHINKNSFLCNYMYGIEQFKQLLLSIIVFSSTIVINPHWSNGRKEV